MLGDCKEVRWSCYLFFGVFDRSLAFGSRFRWLRRAARSQIALGRRFPASVSTFSLVLRASMQFDRYPICARYVPAMCPLCDRYVPVMCPLCARYVPVMCPVCARYVPVMCPLFVGV